MRTSGVVFPSVYSPNVVVVAAFAVALFGGVAVLSAEPSRVGLMV